MRPKLTYANVMSTMCFFLLLGGGAYAAGHLGRNSVGTKQLKKNAVTGAKVKDNSLTGTDINESSLGTVPSAANAQNAEKAANAQNADNAAKLVGKEFVPLAFLAPRGTGNTLIGSIGPLQIFAACSASGQVSVSASSSVGGVFRFTVQGPNGSNTGTRGLSETPVEFVSGPPFYTSPAAFAYKANGRLINGNFMLDYDPEAINCLVSGDMAG